MIFGA